MAPIRLGNDRDVLSQPIVLRLGDEVRESVYPGALFRPDSSLDCLVLGNIRGRASGPESKDGMRVDRGGRGAGGVVWGSYERRGQGCGRCGE